MSDLQAYEIHLRNHDGPLPLHAVRGEWLSGLFYSTFKKPGHSKDGQEGFENLGVQMHGKGQKEHAGETASYAIHVLSEEVEVKGKKLAAVRGVRIASFQAEVGDRIAEVWGARAAKNAEVEFGSAKMTVSDIKPDVRNGLTFSALWDQSPVAYGVVIQFETPTVLERANHIDLLPSPKRLWSGYLRQWEQYAPSDVWLPKEERKHFADWVEKCVYTRSMSIETRPMPIREEKELDGILGRLEFHALVTDEDFPASRLPDYLRGWQMLAMFAEFCGTGAGTTQGFGRTRYLRAFGEKK